MGRAAQACASSGMRREPVLPCFLAERMKVVGKYPLRAKSETNIQSFHKEDQMEILGLVIFCLVVRHFLTLGMAVRTRGMDARLYQITGRR